MHYFGIEDFLAFKCKLVYTFQDRIKKVVKSLLGLSYMPARTLNGLFAGFFVRHQYRTGGWHGHYLQKVTERRCEKNQSCKGYGKGGNRSLKKSPLEVETTE
jgi:hypothetical protein